MPTLLLVFVRKQNCVFVSYERICTKTKFRFTLYMHYIYAGEFGWKPFSISDLNIWLISHFSTHVLLNFYFNLYWNICILIFNKFKQEAHEGLNRSTGWNVNGMESHHAREYWKHKSFHPCQMNYQMAYILFNFKFIIATN